MGVSSARGEVAGGCDKNDGVRAVAPASAPVQLSGMPIPHYQTLMLPVLRRAPEPSLINRRDDFDAIHGEAPNLGLDTGPTPRGSAHKAARLGGVPTRSIEQRSFLPLCNLDRPSADWILPAGAAGPH